MPEPLRRCCVPSVVNLASLKASTQTFRERTRAISGSLEGMVRLDGGPFLMGCEEPYTLPEDGEGPVTRVTLDSFYVSRYAVTNEQFAEFVSSASYQTDAERLGWSFVFRNQMEDPSCGAPMPGAPWWRRVEGACWRRPAGPAFSSSPKGNLPVVHVSWNDATAYCAFKELRLPTEAEWEFASRGGLQQRRYPWGDELMPEGRHRCNIWQGRFPDCDLAEDGFSGPAPVDSVVGNGFGLFNCVGNVWEWCSDYFDREWRSYETRLNPIGPANGEGRVVKGGSFLCHESYCFRYRNSARSSNTADSSTSNLGFRAARD